MIDAEKEVRKTRQMASTCYKCGEAGHAIRNCPRQAIATIEIVADTRDEIDDDAPQAAMYAAHYALVTTDNALFEPEEVIFGIAATKSVFKSPNLLIAVAPSASPL